MATSLIEYTAPEAPFTGSRYRHGGVPTLLTGPRDTPESPNKSAICPTAAT